MVCRNDSSSHPYRNPIQRTQFQRPYSLDELERSIRSSAIIIDRTDSDGLPAWSIFLISRYSTTRSLPPTGLHSVDRDTFERNKETIIAWLVRTIQGLRDVTVKQNPELALPADGGSQMVMLRDLRGALKRVLRGDCDQELVDDFLSAGILNVRMGRIWTWRV